MLHRGCGKSIVPTASAHSHSTCRHQSGRCCRAKSRGQLSLAKRTCSLVLWGYRLIEVWSPPVQRCECWAAWARGWWWWFSWSHQPDLDHRRGQDTWSWHSSLLVSHKIGCFCILWRLPALVQDLQSARQTFLWAISTHWSRQMVAVSTLLAGGSLRRAVTA